MQNQLRSSATGRICEEAHLEAHVKEEQKEEQTEEQTEEQIDDVGAAEAGPVPEWRVQRGSFA